MSAGAVEAVCENRMLAVRRIGRGLAYGDVWLAGRPREDARPIMAFPRHGANMNMEALAVFCKHLEQCREHAREPSATGPLLEAMSVQLALALDGMEKTGDLCAPSRSVQAPRSPDTFTSFEFPGPDRHAVFKSEGDTYLLDLESGDMTRIDYGISMFPDRSRSPDGRYYTDRQDFVGLIDARSHALVRRFSWSRSSSPSCVANVSFSPDSRRLAVSYAYDTNIRLWDTRNGVLVRELAAPDHEACIQFSPDGAYLFAGTKNGAQLFHLMSGLAVYSNRVRQIHAVGYSPSGRSAVTDSGGGRVHQIDLSALVGADTKSVASILETIQVQRDNIRRFTGSRSDWQRLIRLADDF